MGYDANSIKIKDFRNACRDTPAMYLGDDRQNGIFNSFLEILNNACDEAIMGRGNIITIDMEDDKLCLIDRGRGVPHGENKDCKEVLIELFTKSHSSGKFDTDNYKKVRGLHGVGSSAVCVCSSEFEVWTKRDGYIWYLKFIDGIPQTETAIKGNKTNETGTTICFSPNKKVFHLSEKEKCFDYQRIKDELELTSYFIPNVTFELKYNGKTERFLSKNGLKDFAEAKVKNPIHKNFIYGYKEFEDEVEVEVFAQWTKGKEQSYVFSNGALNSEGGTPISGVKSAFTRTINSLTKNSFDGDTIRKGLVYIVNIRHPHPIYQNQVKNKIQNPELRGYTQIVFTEAIKDFAKNNTQDFNSIIDTLLKIEKAEIAAEKARVAIMESQKDIEKNQKKKVFASDKLKDAEFLGEDSILLLVEGNSASSAMAVARNIENTGILGLRGKCINTFTNSDEDIYQNEEMKLLLSALNITPGKYNSKKLRYGKVAITVDADSDGYAIGLLIMCAFYKFAPDFIKEGRLCWLRAPLYIIKTKNKDYYYYSDEEFNNSKIKGETIRIKGLGAMTAEQAHDSMFTKEFQRLDTLIPDEESYNLLLDLMGNDSSKKRKFIFDNIDFNEIRE